MTRAASRCLRNPVDHWPVHRAGCGLDLLFVLSQRPRSAPEVNAWLAGNPNVTFHFTPVGSSWMNQIETPFRKQAGSSRT